MSTRSTTRLVLERRQHAKGVETQTQLIDRILWLAAVAVDGSGTVLSPAVPMTFPAIAAGFVNPDVEINTPASLAAAFTQANQVRLFDGLQVAPTLYTSNRGRGWLVPLWSGRLPFAVVVSDFGDAAAVYVFFDTEGVGPCF